MKLNLLLFVTLIVSTFSFTQNSQVEGVVKDKVTQETVIGAYVFLGEENVAVTDYEGKFVIKVPYGIHQIKITYVGYADFIDTVEVKSGYTPLEVEMNTEEIQEVEVVADLGEVNRTPVSITKIDQRQLSEELGSRDLPMVLNSTPGIYATNQGGGDGDARITMRGFSQRNIAVMVDGVPVNDMENGWVYWSNWFGLDAITQSMQVQRGLGASKIVSPSVGGTINIVTSGMENKFGVKLRYEAGSGLFNRVTVGYNSGKLKGDWGITFAGSFKYRDGWVDKANSLGGFYYLKVQKKLGNHMLSLSGFGAPQKHGQRSYKAPIATWNHDKALRYGADTTGWVERGYRYNEHWGMLTRRTGEEELINEKLNYYHKPQLTLRHFGKLKEGLYLSNVVYASIGNGGGTKMYDYGGAYRTPDGQIDFDRIWDANQFTEIAGNIYPTIDPIYDSTALKSSNILTSAVNNHWWVGYLGNIKYQMNKKWVLTAGIDYRYYEGEHYHEVYDLLGGDYFLNSADLNTADPMKRVGDKIAWKPYHRHRDALVQWAGVYALVEYKGTRWNVFLNASFSANGYKGIDYFNKKTLQVGDTTLRIGAVDTIFYNGEEYNASSAGLEYDQTNWKWIPAYTFKAGANYRLTEKMGVYINTGYLSRAPMFTNVVDYEATTLRFYNETQNEEIFAGELGYTANFPKFAFAINGYATYWKNKPHPFGFSLEIAPGEFEKYNVFDMSAVHLGGEMNFTYKIIKQLSVEGMVSYGDWRWASPGVLRNATDTIRFDPTGVHVSDAAQSVYALAIRSDFVKGAYIKIRYTIFDRHWANMDPFNLRDENERRDSWRMPTYGVMDINLGYTHKFDKVALLIRGNIFNVLNTAFIQDGQNNGFGTGYEDFDAKSATVFFGQGITWNVSLGLNIF